MPDEIKPAEQKVTMTSEVTQEPQKKIMDYAIESLELNRIIGVGLVCLAGFALYGQYKGMCLPNSTPDMIMNGMSSCKEITLLVVGALAGYLTKK